MMPSELPAILPRLLATPRVMEPSAPSWAVKFSAVILSWPPTSPKTVPFQTRPLASVYAGQRALTPVGAA